MKNRDLPSFVMGFDAKDRKNYELAIRKLYEDQGKQDFYLCRDAVGNSFTNFSVHRYDKDVDISVFEDALKAVTREISIHTSTEWTTCQESFL